MKSSLRIAAAILATTCLSSAAMAANNLTGAGGTAIYPVLQVWAQKYQQTNGDQVNYQAIGSGGGIKQIEAKTVDFANSDKPLMHDEIAQNHLVQFPEVVISIVPVIHIEGVANGQMVLGWLSAIGGSVEQSWPDAIDWSRKAAEQGNARAQADLGWMLLARNDAPRRYSAVQRSRGTRPSSANWVSLTGPAPESSTAT